MTAVGKQTPLVDMTDYFECFGFRQRTQLDIQVELLPEMYQPSDVVHHHWLYFAFEAFRRLRAYYALETNRAVDTFCDIGTSSGLDAIGAWEGLRPRKMVVTDVVTSVLDTARRNILRNCLDISDDDVLALGGDLAAPLHDDDINADVVYANLPTLPMDADSKTIAASGATAASFYPEHRREHRPRVARDTLLELYFSFLTDIAPCLNPGGMVLCAVGGRVEWDVIESMFRRCGFDASLLLFDLKPQEQATECLPVYARFEDANTQFRFYSYEEAHQQLSELDGDEPNLPFNERMVRHNHAVDALAPFSLSATEALRLHETGYAVGHLVYMIVGKQRNAIRGQT